MLVESVSTTQTPEIVNVAATEPKIENQQRDPKKSSRGNGEDVEFLKDVLEVAANHFQISDVGLDFSVHGKTGRIQVSVTDKESGEVIREIPPEEVLNLMAKLDEMMGILYDEKA